MLPKFYKIGKKSIYKYFQWLYNRIIERRKQKIEKQKSEKDTLELEETQRRSWNQTIQDGRNAWLCSIIKLLLQEGKRNVRIQIKRDDQDKGNLIRSTWKRTNARRNLLRIVQAVLIRKDR